VGALDNAAVEFYGQTLGIEIERADEIGNGVTSARVAGLAIYDDRNRHLKWFRHFRQVDTPFSYSLYSKLNVFFASRKNW
jgi:hypothetical protein